MNFGKLVIGCVFFAGLTASAQATTVLVESANGSPTTIASVTAGQSYTISVTGIDDLLANYQGLGLTFHPDGTPARQFGSQYAAFNPDGSDKDPASGNYGIGGPGKLYGALLGTYSQAPTAADYFVIGNGGTFTPDSTGTLYAIINDIAYTDNGSSALTVEFTPSISSAVPEPSTWAMMILGFLGIGAMTYRNRNAVLVA